jgi:hypothetical protein
MGEELVETVRSGAVWEEFCDALKRSGELVLENGRDETFERAEGYRYLARVTRHALKSFIDPPDPARPCFDHDTPRIAGDNPDFRYGTCAVNGAWDYRIRGRRNDAFDIGIGSYYGGLGTKQGLQCSGYLSLNEMESDADGSFEVVASQQEKPGNWLPMTPETNNITAREVLLVRRSDRPAELSIERLAPPGESPAPPGPPDPEALARAVQAAGLFAGGVVRQFMGWTHSFASHPNEIRKLDPELLKVAKGDPATRYYNGYFDLADDEALVVDLAPPECEYWNIQVANHWLESLDYMNHDTHVNHRTASYADDGTVQVIISKRDPGLPNWIDTVGHDRGCIALRWTKAAHDSQPRTRVAKLGDLKRR